jgi:Na+/citrate or Na+/malate symporter
MVTSLVGGLSGWVVQGMCHGFILWSLPLFWVASFLITLNGDNFFESLVLLLVLGVPCCIGWKTHVVVDKIGGGTIWGLYAAACISKLGFALGKAGVFGNNPFS